MGVMTQWTEDEKAKNKRQLNALMKKIKSLDQNAAGALRTKPVELKITEVVRNSFNQCGNACLTDHGCAQLESFVWEFSRQFQGQHALKLDPGTKKRLKQISGQCQALLDGLKRINFGLTDWDPALSEDAKTSYFVGGVFRTEQLLHGRFLEHLARLRDGIDSAVSEHSPRGRPSLTNYLMPFMLKLEEFYTAAGGGSTKVSRGTSDKRKSRFVDFAYEVLQMIPRDHRPPGVAQVDALMSWWEEHAPRGDQGDLRKSEDNSE
jgi:hypothetical protein